MRAVVVCARSRVVLVTLPALARARVADAQALSKIISLEAERASDQQTSRTSSQEVEQLRAQLEQRASEFRAEYVAEIAVVGSARRGRLVDAAAGS